MAKPNGATKPQAQARADKERTEQPTTGEVYKAAKIDPTKIRGELGDFIVSRMKAATHLKAWEQMSEEEQREQIEQALFWADTIIAGTAQAMMTRGLPSRPVKLGKFSGAVGESTIEVKATMILDKEVGDRISGGVTDAVMVFASLEAYQGGEMETRPAPDQTDLMAGGDADEEEHDKETGEIPPPVEPPEPPAPQPSA